MKESGNVLLDRLNKYLQEKLFLRSKEKILIACSGGPDSVALTHLLLRIAPENKWRLGVVHFDHRLRAASKKDARFVRGLARKLGLRFYGGSGDVKGKAEKTRSSIEEAARGMRYDFFVRTAKRLRVSKVVLAHTIDDQAETVLMRVLQGTGPRGLQGIRELNTIRGVSFLRPLLRFAKKELLDFLRVEKVAFRKDASNDSLKFLRNRIRLKLLPALRRDFNPRVTESIARIPAIVAEESALLAALAEKAWQKAFKNARRGKVELRRAIFLKMHPALQFRLVERALKKLDPQSGLSFEAWERLRSGLGRFRYRCSLPRDIDFMLTPKNAILYKK